MMSWQELVGGLLCKLFGKKTMYRLWKANYKSKKGLIRVMKLCKLKGETLGVGLKWEVDKDQIGGLLCKILYRIFGERLCVGLESFLIELLNHV